MCNLSERRRGERPTWVSSNAPLQPETTTSLHLRSHRRPLCSLTCGLFLRQKQLTWLRADVIEPGGEVTKRGLVNKGGGGVGKGTFVTSPNKSVLSNLLCKQQMKIQRDFFVCLISLKFQRKPWTLMLLELVVERGRGCMGSSLWTSAEEIRNSILHRASAFAQRAQGSALKREVGRWALASASRGGWNALAKRTPKSHLSLCLPSTRPPRWCGTVNLIQDN